MNIGGAWVCVRVCIKADKDSACQHIGLFNVVLPSQAIAIVGLTGAETEVCNLINISEILTVGGQLSLYSKVFSCKHCGMEKNHGSFLSFVYFIFFILVFCCFVCLLFFFFAFLLRYFWFNSNVMKLVFSENISLCRLYRWWDFSILLKAP